ncbi:hypothetical protein [Treponema sp. OMZ 788]|uniref:hypothetical protein n=1 Tax=Treponema sp. OMZ 788 TaxID=2563664 RepID=UPI0020A575D6|nr:hypothetical protein [Treponema sp. OMZ 788]
MTFCIKIEIKTAKNENKKIYSNVLADKFSFFITINAQTIERAKEIKIIAAICIQKKEYIEKELNSRGLSDKAFILN